MNVNVLSNISAESLNWNVKDSAKGHCITAIKMMRTVFPYSVCMVNTTGSLNIGTSIRSAEILGASRFITAGKNRFDRRSTVGATNYIPLSNIDCLDDSGNIKSDVLYRSLIDLNVTPVAVEQGGIDITSFDISGFNSEICLVFGSESSGLPQDFLDLCEYRVSIAQYGVLRSFNVAAAAAIVCHTVANRFSLEK